MKLMQKCEVFDADDSVLTPVVVFGSLLTGLGITVWNALTTNGDSMAAVMVGVFVSFPAAAFVTVVVCMNAERIVNKARYRANPHSPELKNAVTPYHYE